MFSRPWLALLRRQVLIHRRALAFCLTVAAVLLGWTAFVARPPVGSPADGGVRAALATPTLRPGVVRIPVRFADGEMAGLLHPGERIQLWAIDSRASRSRVIARDAEVIEVPGPSPNSGSAGRQSRVVVLGIHAAEVEIVANFNANGVLTYTSAQ